MIGFGDVHTRAHIYRAVIEGLGYALRDGLHESKKEGGSLLKNWLYPGAPPRVTKSVRSPRIFSIFPWSEGKPRKPRGLGQPLLPPQVRGSIIPSMKPSRKWSITAPNSVPIPTMWRSMQNSMGGSTGGCITDCGPSIERYRILPATLKNKPPLFKNDGFECLSDFFIASAKRPPH